LDEHHCCDVFVVFWVQAWVAKVATLLQDKHAPLRAAAVEYVATLYVTLPAAQPALFHFLTAQVRGHVGVLHRIGVPRATMPLFMGICQQREMFVTSALASSGCCAMRSNRGNRSPQALRMDHNL